MGPRSLARTAGALLVVAAVAGSGAPSAAALRSDPSLIRDCARDGRLDARYGADQLRHALTQLPGDVDEYTNCRDVITAALLASPGERSGARGPRGGSGPSNASAGGADGRRSAVVAPSDSVVADS